MTLTFGLWDFVAFAISLLLGRMFLFQRTVFGEDCLCALHGEQTLSTRNPITYSFLLWQVASRPTLLLAYKVC